MVYVYLTLDFNVEKTGLLVVHSLWFSTIQINLHISNTQGTGKISSNYIKFELERNLNRGTKEICSN